MTDAQFASAMAAIPPTIFALAALLNSWRNGKHIAEVKQTTERIEAHTNGMQIKLQAAAKAEGKLEEKGEQAIRKGEDTPMDVVVVRPAEVIVVKPDVPAPKKENKK